MDPSGSGHTNVCVSVCSGGMPSNRITPEFSKWANDGKKGQKQFSCLDRERTPLYQIYIRYNNNKYRMQNIQTS